MNKNGNKGSRSDGWKKLVSLFNKFFTSSLLTWNVVMGFSHPQIQCVYNLTYRNIRRNVRSIATLPCRSFSSVQLQEVEDILFDHLILCTFLYSICELSKLRSSQRSWQRCNMCPGPYRQDTTLLPLNKNTFFHLCGFSFLKLQFYKPWSYYHLFSWAQTWAKRYTISQTYPEKETSLIYYHLSLEKIICGQLLPRLMTKDCHLLSAAERTQILLSLFDFTSLSVFPTQIQLSSKTIKLIKQYSLFPYFHS